MHDLTRCQRFQTESFLGRKCIMPYAFNLMEYFTTSQNIDFLIRIIVACFCGALIGYERSRRFIDAGVRTHLIVCCAAASLMIVSKYGFVDLVAKNGDLLYGTRGADPARIAAQVVSGVGFLGAGAIFRNKNIVKGLTTAAGIWATAGIGLAIGAGMYWIGIVATAIISLFQVVTHKFTIGSDSFTTNFLEFDVDSDINFQTLLTQFAESTHGKITSYSIDRAGHNLTHYSVTMKNKGKISMEDLHQFIDEHKGVRSASTSFM